MMNNVIFGVLLLCPVMTSLAMNNETDEEWNSRGSEAKGPEKNQYLKAPTAYYPQKDNISVSSSQITYGSLGGEKSNSTQKNLRDLENTSINHKDRKQSVGTAEDENVGTAEDENTIDFNVIKEEIQKDFNVISEEKQKGCCQLLWEFVCCKKDNNHQTDHNPEHRDRRYSLESTSAQHDGTNNANNYQRIFEIRDSKGNLLQSIEDKRMHYTNNTPSEGPKSWSQSQSTISKGGDVKSSKTSLNNDIFLLS